ncbi:MAG TPA: hypothetical protein EYN67_18470 [Flavobacteriales bacterium]|nr:hypothetical protein [Flavobacteriales bacterium]
MRYNYSSKYGLNKVEKKQTNRIVKRAINSAHETKQYTHGRVSNFEFTQSQPLLSSFLNVPQALHPAENSRVGDNINFKHLRIDYDIVGSVDGLVKSGFPVDRVRMLLVRWAEPSNVGGVANNPDMIDLFGAAGLPLGTNLFTAQINHEEGKRRFKVLLDRKITLCGDIQTMLTCDSPEKKQTHGTIKISQKRYGFKQVKYDSLLPSNNSHMNELYLFVLTDNPGGVATAAPTISLDSRLLFTE